ncbi:MAG: ABC transporter permease [Clostridia bacterium]|nr:MAG: ABC transporter permease [Clostridia bacterium]
MLLSMATSSLEPGLIYGLMALGVYISFRILNFADLTVDGSLTLGAAIAASVIVAGYNPWLGTIAALLAGLVAGACTGVLHAFLGISSLLSGILTMTGLYSVNLRVLGRANISLLRSPRIYYDISRTGLPEEMAVLFLSLATLVVIIYLVNLLLETEVGLSVRATGDNEQMIRSLGVDTRYTKIIGLSLSNGLVALSGAYVAQYQGFADISMGIGTIVAGLASVIIGEVVLGAGSVWRGMVAAVLGSFVYRLVITLVLWLGFKPTDLKLMTAVLVVLALASPQIRRLLRLTPREAG